MDTGASQASGSPGRKRTLPATGLSLSAHFRAEEAKALLPPGCPSISADEFRSRFELGEVVGRGVTSVVRAARNRATGEIFAVKIIDKRRLVQQARIQEEIEILNSLRHDSVTRLYQVAETPFELLLVTDIALGGELYDRIVSKGRYSEEETRIVMLQVLQALAHLHSKMIIHRDVKPENILVMRPDSDTEVKLSDFGFAKQIKRGRFISDVEAEPRIVGSPTFSSPLPPSTLGPPGHGLRSDARRSSRSGSVHMGHSSVTSIGMLDDDISMGALEEERGRTSRAETLVGTAFYIAPEIVRGQSYGVRVDIWSAGVVLYVLLCGNPPFFGDDSAIYRQIVQGSFSFSDPIWASISPLAKDLITKMLTVDPGQRISSEAALQHPWLRNPVR